MNILDIVVEVIILIGFGVGIYAVLFCIKALKDEMKKER